MNMWWPKYKITIFKTVQARILIKTGSHFAKHTGVEYVKAMKPATRKWIKFKMT